MDVLIAEVIQDFRIRSGESLPRFLIPLQIPHKPSGDITIRGVRHLVLGMVLFESLHLERTVRNRVINIVLEILRIDMFVSEG